MAATDVSICSNALLLLGAKTISSFNDDSDGALLASNLFEITRDSIIRSHPWNCCIKRETLAPDAATSQPDWAYQFSLPSDVLRVISVGEAGIEDPYLVEGRKILCDQNPLYLRYVYRNTDPTSWDAMLVRACELAMAAAMAYPITLSASVRDSMRQELEMHMRRARSVDGQEDPPQTFGDSYLIASRYSGRGF